MPVTVTHLTDPPEVVLPESFAWLCLGLVLVVSHPREISAWSALALFCRRSFFFQSNAQRNSRKRRRHHVSTIASNDEDNELRRKLWKAPRDQGLAILILTSLWTLARPVGYSSYAWVLPWFLANRKTIMSRVLVSPSSPSANTTTTYYVVVSLGAFGLWCHTAWQWYAPGKILVAHVLGDALNHVTALHKVFTIDEWAIVSFLAAGAWLEWMQQIAQMRRVGLQYFDSIDRHPDKYMTLVACAGNIGVLWAASWVGTQRKIWPLTLQILVLLVLPLILVEVSLMLVTSVNDGDNEDDGIILLFSFLPNHLIPRSIQWLMNFLLQTEDPVWDTIRPFNLPRLVWLIYWIVVAGAGIVAAPTRPSRVVTRKWFHAVAVMLFTPVTMYAPVLQSLGYAVAVAVLVGLEGIRPSWPLLQRYFARYLDPAKDRHNGKRTGMMVTNAIIISHTALILGCAIPLWCYQMSDARLAPIVPFGGIIVLGVGDALGAVVGKWYGRNTWASWLENLPKRNRRTLEGSLAMLIGQIMFVALLAVWGIPVEWILIGPPILFVTIVEAWTSQMDNLLLPLAVTAFYGLWEQVVDIFSPLHGYAQ